MKKIITFARGLEGSGYHIISSMLTHNPELTLIESHRAVVDDWQVNLYTALLKYENKGILEVYGYYATDHKWNNIHKDSIFVKMLELLLSKGLPYYIDNPAIADGSIVSMNLKELKSLKIDYGS